ncbi:hypothetical protein HPG69_016325 [Diceros bicornis minor]|uniref:Uncharacterized protein n=1 Tax=Diceros bicornis minor TaxID=77932 RepID=A0A7J7F7B2_DICBM|nr:hypothetical protein HPG69_016325 [Diceros bicornis minor]
MDTVMHPQRVISSLILLLTDVLVSYPPGSGKYRHYEAREYLLKANVFLTIENVVKVDSGQWYCCPSEHKGWCMLTHLIIGTPVLQCHLESLLLFLQCQHPHKTMNWLHKFRRLHHLLQHSQQNPSLRPCRKQEGHNPPAHFALLSNRWAWQGASLQMALSITIKLKCLWHKIHG